MWGNIQSAVTFFNRTGRNFSYTPYMIKPSTSNTSGYISYIDLLKFGQVTDFGYLQGYTSFSVYMGKFYNFDS